MITACGRGSIDHACSHARQNKTATPDPRNVTTTGLRLHCAHGNAMETGGWGDMSAVLPAPSGSGIVHEGSSGTCLDEEPAVCGWLRKGDPSLLAGSAHYQHGDPRLSLGTSHVGSWFTGVRFIARDAVLGTLQYAMGHSPDTIRDHLLRALDWEEAHVGLEKAVDGIPPDKRGARAAGFEHSAWQLLEHIRIAQEDILDFCVNAQYVHDRTWPDDYWPKDPGPPDANAWTSALAAYGSSLEGLKRLVRDVDDLTGRVPTGKANHTYLRAILLVIDHTAYHVGQLVGLRRALGLWS
jgi:uncharacterized damage-inducible protein DinB